MLDSDCRLWASGSGPVSAVVQAVVTGVLFMLAVAAGEYIGLVSTDVK